MLIKFAMKLNTFDRYLMRTQHNSTIFQYGLNFIVQCHFVTSIALIGSILAQIMARFKGF